jgi:hypothetical protein
MLLTSRFHTKKENYPQIFPASILFFLDLHGMPGEQKDTKICA